MFPKIVTNAVTNPEIFSLTHFYVIFSTGKSENIFSGKFIIHSIKNKK